MRLFFSVFIIVFLFPVLASAQQVQYSGSSRLTIFVTIEDETIRLVSNKIISTYEATEGAFLLNTPLDQITIFQGAALDTAIANAINRSFQEGGTLRIYVYPDRYPIDLQSWNSQEKYIDARIDLEGFGFRDKMQVKGTLYKDDLVLKLGMVHIFSPEPGSFRELNRIQEIKFYLEGARLYNVSRLIAR